MSLSTELGWQENRYISTSDSSVDALGRAGLYVLTIGFPLQFALRGYLDLPRVVLLWSDITILTIFFLLMLRSRVLNGAFKFSVSKYFFALAAVALLSMSLNGSPFNNFLELLRLVLIGPLLAVIVLNLKASERYWRKLSGLIAVTLALQVPIILLQISTGAGNVDAGQGTFGANTANSIGDAMAIATAVLAWQLIKGKWVKKNALLAGLLSLGVVITSSRLSLFLLPVALLSLLVVGRKLKFRYLLIVLAGGAVFLGVTLWYYVDVARQLFLLSVQREVDVASTVGYGGTAPRLLLYGWAWQSMGYLSRLPRLVMLTFGLGPGMFGSYVSMQNPTPFSSMINYQWDMWRAVGTPGIYSEYLALFCELGAIGFLVVVFMYRYLWKNLWKVFKLRNDALSESVIVGGLVALAILIARGFFSNVLEDRVVGFYAWLYIGLALRFCRQRGAKI
ncbi:MAG: hypothetical protein M1378_10345 [Bacteroidetes bacterium]|nr:hypothetical protein [Bacteroidota bacterium]